MRTKEVLVSGPVLAVGSPDLRWHRAFSMKGKKMKVCETCAVEIPNTDGINTCHKCQNVDPLEDPRIGFSEDMDRKLKNEDAYQKRGLTRVVKPCGGVHWE
jgi:hypothetical protein